MCFFLLTLSEGLNTVHYCTYCIILLEGEREITIQMISDSQAQDALWCLMGDPELLATATLNSSGFLNET